MANLDEELLKAAKIGDINTARSLLDQGAKMDARLVEYNGRTSIHLAAMHGQVNGENK
jgi:ankyrin repeat protein